MREDPGLDAGAIAACLRAAYNLAVTSVAYLPLGYDLNAAVFKVAAAGTTYFLKVRFGPVFAPGLAVPRALIDQDAPNILAPLRTRSGALWAPLDGSPGATVVLYPFVPGENAMEAGMTAAQWREFGATLRAVHDSGLADIFRGQLRSEDFLLPSAALVRQMLVLVEERSFAGPAAVRFAAFWRENAARIRAMLARAEELGQSLQTRSFPLVLCHADIHAANILVNEEGITLIDWDGPILAPRERDLLFIIGSTIARRVEPREEADFFDGYGRVEIDPAALIYYRYERIIEDIGEMGRGVFLDPERGEEAKMQEVDLAMRFFAPGGDLDRAETVVSHW